MASIKDLPFYDMWKDRADIGEGIASADAPVIVSGDRHLSALKTFQGIAIAPIARHERSARHFLR